jgi:2-polyprenyl-3-methyl-5-hydroxy-6-metoxy-1,4-benzoquinol methylase
MEKGTKSFGKEIWEKKMSEQGINGVIGGVAASDKWLKKRAGKIFEQIRKEIFPLMNGKKIIDIGVGSGVFLIWFSKSGYHCDGLDIAENTLGYAKNAAEKEGIKTEFFCKDITRDFPNKKYDLVFCFGTFGHFPAYSALRAMENFKNMVDEAGIIYIHFWKPKKLTAKNIFHDFVYNLLRVMKRNIFGRAYYVNCSFYSASDIKEMANLSGLKIIKIHEGNGDYQVILKK